MFLLTKSRFQRLTAEAKEIVLRNGGNYAAIVAEINASERGNVDKIVLIVIAGIMIAALVPVALAQIVGVDTSGWTGDFAVLANLWPVVAIFLLVAIILVVWKTASGGGGSSRRR